MLLVGVVGVSAPALAYLPRAAMAGVLFLIAWSLVDFRNIRRIARTGASEAVVLWMTFGATLLFDLEFAIILGVMLSLVVFLRRASRPSLQARLPDPKLARRHFVTDPDLPECPQLKILRVNGPIFFGAVNYVAERLRILARRSPRQKHLLLLARSINFVDVAGAELLAREARHRRAIGGGLYLHQLKEEAREPLDRGGYLDEIGRENVFESKGDAIETIFGRLDRNTCTACALRVFRECHEIERGEGAAPPGREKAAGGTKPGGASPEAAAVGRGGGPLRAGVGAPRTGAGGARRRIRRIRSAGGGAPRTGAVRPPRPSRPRSAATHGARTGSGCRAESRRTRPRTPTGHRTPAPRR